MRFKLVSRGNLPEGLEIRTMHRHHFAVLLLLLNATYCSAASSIKWGQDLDNLFVTLGPDCSEFHNATFSVSDATITCRGASGPEEVTIIKLREDIIPRRCTCKMKSKEIYCTLMKREPHMFDRLTAHADDLGGMLKQDWDKLTEDPDADIVDTSDPFEKVGTDIIKRFSFEEFVQAIDEKDAVIADLSASWCTEQNPSKKHFIAAAKEMASDKMIFVRVDSLEFPEVARQYQVRCSPDTVLHFFRKGLDVEAIKVKEDDKELAKTITSRMRPLLIRLKSDVELKQFQKKHPMNAVAIFPTKGGWFGAKPGQDLSDSQEFRALGQAAAILRSRIPVAFHEGGFGEGFCKMNHVRVSLKDHEDWTEIPFSTDGKILARQVGAETFPFVDTYAYEKREQYDSLQMPVIMLFIKDEPFVDDDVLYVADQIARKYRGRLGLVKMLKSHTYMIQDFGLQLGDEPAIGITQSFHWNSLRYVHEGNITIDEVSLTVDSFLSGNATPAFKSEAIPKHQNWTHGMVRIVVKKELDKYVGVNSVRDMLIMVFRPWQHNFNKCRDAFVKIAKSFVDVEEIMLGAIDVSKNYFDSEIWLGLKESDTDGFTDPGVYLCRKGEIICTKHAGEVSQKEIYKFAAKESSHVKDSWESKIKPRIKKIKEEEAERKQKAVEMAEKRKKDAADEKARIEKLFETAKEIKITKGGSITKRIIHEGSGATPQAGEYVRVQYTGTLMDGTKFDSSRDRDSSFKFKVGTNTVISCWDRSIVTMKVGERAFLVCDPKSAYGKKGNPPLIPPEATLRFDVELLSVHKDDEPEREEPEEVEEEETEAGEGEGGEEGEEGEEGAKTEL